MNEKELIGKIHSSMYHQLQVRGYATPVDVLIDTGILPKQKYEDWRFGRVRYLEAVCNANLKRLSFVLHQMRVYAQAHELKPSFCYYKRWGVRKRSGTGHKPVIPLQFSKSGSPEIERTVLSRPLPGRSTSWSRMCSIIRSRFWRGCVRRTRRA